MNFATHNQKHHSSRARNWAMLAWVALASLGLFPSALRADDVESKVESLLKQMTLEEKIDMIGGDADGFSTKAVARLNIPKLVMSDGPQGVRCYGKSCCFPSTVAMAATWDTALAQRHGSALAQEARARGVHILLGPGANIARLSICGRNFEYAGEDPYLAGEMTSSYIRGVQSGGVAACIKHYACNSQEWFRTTISSCVSERAMQEIYLPAFRRAVKEGVWSVMSAYNRVNGDYCTANDYLQNKVLKEMWGFKGVVMSDWGAVHETGGVILAGMDLEMPKSKFLTPATLKPLLESGKVTESILDDKVRRILRLSMSNHFFERPQKLDLPLDNPESATVARQVAESALVLLKNEKAALPLDRTKIHRIAVYGPNAEKTPVVGGGSGGVQPFHSTSFLDGIMAAAGKEIEVVQVSDPKPEKTMFEKCLTARTAPNGEPGLRLTVFADGREVADLPHVVPGVNIEWKKGERPMGITAKNGVKLVWEGVLQADEDMEVELIKSFPFKGMQEVKIGERTMSWPNQDGLKLAKGKAVPIRVEMQVSDTLRNNCNFRVGLRPRPKTDLEAAKKADAVIFCGGLNEVVECEGHPDRDYELPRYQQATIRELAAANPRTVVVLNSGAGVGMTGWIDRVPAVLHAWYLGQEGGTALGEVLFGDVNPSGKLPTTFERTIEDNAAWTTYPFAPGSDKEAFPRSDYKEGIFVGYRGYDKANTQVMFPFGHGLSYTTFEISSLKVKKTESGRKVSVEVANTGKRPGAEVVQIYVGQPKCSVERPVRELKGFAKVMLQPGQKQTVEIELNSDAFEFWHPIKKQWILEPGSFVIEAGQSSRDIKCRKTVQID